MDPIQDSGTDSARGRRQLTAVIRESLRALTIELSLLNHQVSAHLDLKDADISCLDLIARHGPLSPTALARRTGLHPATLTGVLDRLERSGWVTRDRDPADRRAVLVRALRDRNAEILALYRSMNTSLEQICASYGEADLHLLADFLRRTTEAGHRATGELASGPT